MGLLEGDGVNRDAKRFTKNAVLKCWKPSYNLRQEFSNPSLFYKDGYRLQTPQGSNCLAPGGH
jgi:hypothetical protein